MREVDLIGKVMKMEGRMERTMNNREELRRMALSSIDAARDDLVDSSHDIFEYSELAFEEVRSAERLRNFLSDLGFRVKDVDGLPTGFVAELVAAHL